METLLVREIKRKFPLSNMTCLNGLMGCKCK